MSEEQKFPTEVIDLPSEGKLYPEGHPLASGKIELKYMTAKEEDILTSQNLIKKGLVIDKLLSALIVTKGVNLDDLVLGDKNAVMVAARILAYGAEYECEITNPKTGGRLPMTFNLADCPFRKLPKDIDKNHFDVELPVSKAKVSYKILDGNDEKIIDKELKQISKLGGISPELTTRLKHTVISVNGDSEKTTINNFVDALLARDSMHLRSSIKNTAPDIILKQEIEVEEETVEVDIPLTVNFFWPNTLS